MCYVMTLGPMTVSDQMQAVVSPELLFHEECVLVCLRKAAVRSIYCIARSPVLHFSDHFCNLLGRHCLPSLHCLLLSLLLKLLRQPLCGSLFVKKEKTILLCFFVVAMSGSLNMGGLFNYYCIP